MNTTTTTTEKSLVRTYMEACGAALLEPGKFFRERFAHLPLSMALAYGILSVWLASFVAFLWDSVNFIFISSLLDQWMDDIFLNDDTFQFFAMGPSQFLFSAGSLLLLPFSTLFFVLFAGMILYFFAKLLSAPHSSVNYIAAIRIMSFALLGMWFIVVPIFGTILAYVAVLVLGVIGVRESFSVSNRRAIMILVMPQILLFFLIFTALLVLLAVAFTLPWTSLGMQL